MANEHESGVSAWEMLHSVHYDTRVKYCFCGEEKISLCINEWNNRDTMECKNDDSNMAERSQAEPKADHTLLSPSEIIC